MGGYNEAGASSAMAGGVVQGFLSGLGSSALRRKIPSASSSAAIAGHGADGRVLVRRLGLIQLVLLGIGASIGSGIFVVTGTVARDAGPAVTFSFIIAGIACALNALCYAELSSYFPAVVGGAYLYSYAAFNELTAFLVFTQVMVDYHIGAASIARSLASYLMATLELVPLFRDYFPSWIGKGGKELFGGAVSINLLAPVILIILTAILCQGVGESSMVNSAMTVVKVVIVIVVIFVGAFEIDVSNWTPFAPNGVKAVVTGATVVFFAFIGFDAVANSAEESKRPQRDLPIGILASLIVCALLYVGVCLVVTGMVPYYLLGEDAPLAEAFISKGLKFISILISIGAIAGLTTTLLVGLFVQSRLYLGLGRDGLLPSIFAEVHPSRHTPVKAQLWVGAVAGVMAGIFNVRILSHILSVGTLTGYSVVSGCVVVLRWKDAPRRQTSIKGVSARQEGITYLILIALSGFATGLCYRFGASAAFPVMTALIGILSTAALYVRQVHSDAPGFNCPWVPAVPALSIFFNIFLFAQLHVEAWWRFIILSTIAIGFYAIYGQYHTSLKEHDDDSSVYLSVPTAEAP
ncbi:cationic amino acid transporter 9 [Wolffia australiana]